ncbi:MAG TPA: FkbM family methyltransferase [Thermoanaerobaculia bacterium]
MTPPAPRAGSRGASRWLYYLSSIPTLLGGMRPRGAVLRLFLGLPTRRPAELELSGGLKFRVRTRMDVWVLKETCLDRDYERDTRLEPDWTIVDVGAAMGDFTVHAARQCPNGIVYAFEPLPDSFARLEDHVRINGIGNVRAFPEAIARAEGTLELYTVTGLSGQHRTAGDGSGAAAPALSVPATTLGNAFARHGITRCDLLKLDCEGAEFEILLGLAPAVLARVARIVLEYHDHVTAHTHEELARRLEERGFDVTVRPNPAWRELGFLYAENRALVPAQRTR